MKRIWGILVLGIFLNACERVPLDYVEPATKRLDNYTRYSCKYTDNNSWRNAEFLYWYYDVSFSKGNVYIQSASIYTGRSKNTGNFFKIDRPDNQKIVILSRNSKHEYIFFYGTSGDLISKGKIFANCVKIEGPDQKLADSLKKLVVL